MEIKEPTRKHKIPATGESWMKREMRKPFRVMFWIFVVCVGFGLVVNLIVYLVDPMGSPLGEILKTPNKPAVSEKRVVTNSQREETKRAEAELQRAKAEYAKVKAELIAVRSWADAEFGKSNAKLQAVVNWLVTPDGELGMPEKEAQRYLDDAMEVCAQRGREIDAVVEAAKRKAHRAGNKLIEAKRKARDAGVELEKIAF